MAPPAAPPSPARRRLPRRDLVLLPLLALATLLVMLAGAEIAARWRMPAVDADSCLVPDAVLGQRPRPLCASRTKSPEGDWVDNRYNDCGYRSDTPCHATPAGPRLAVLGSSSSWGYHIPTPQTWWDRTRDDLSRACGRPLDVQNLSGVFDLAQIASRVPETLALRPAAVAMLIAPFDLDRLPPGDFAPARAGGPGKGVGLTRPTLAKALYVQLLQSRAWVAAQHFLFRQPANYVPLYLQYGDRADFLRAPFTPAWRRRLDYADHALGYVADQAHAAGVPVVLVFVPQQAQADIVATGMTVPGVDPLALGRALGAIARRHGIVYRDMTGLFRGRADTPDLYLNVDGHLNGRGNALVAQVAEDALTGRDGPVALRACKQVAAR